MANGQQCRTSRDLDTAMLSTRDFWFQQPTEWDELSPRSQWLAVLSKQTVDTMTSYFWNIMEGTALPPLQVGVLIPKAKMLTISDPLECLILLIAS